MRLTIEEVKKRFSDAGCELLENTFISSKTKMKYKCSCGNISTINLNNFTSGKRCRLCGVKKSSDKKRYTFNQVYNIFLRNGCELLEQNYVDCLTPMKYKCKCGNIGYISLSQFKDGHRCYNCIGKKKFNYDYVYNYFLNKECLLLENTYVNNHTRMKYRCKCGNVDYTTFSDFQRKICCRKCVIDVKKFSFREVYDYFLENNCLLLENKYINCKTLMRYKCSCGNESHISFDSFKRGHRCAKCYGNERLTLDFVREEFSKRNYILLEKVYVNRKTRMKVKCPNNHIGTIAYNDFHHGAGCLQCAIDKRKGENNCNWNPNLTYEERLKKRCIVEVTYWRNDVYKRDNYTCQICGLRGGKLNAHHLDGYHWCKERRFDIDNGVTLCKDCHDEFHQTYGRKNNTEEQFNKFVKSIQILQETS